MRRRAADRMELGGRSSGAANVPRRPGLLMTLLMPLLMTPLMLVGCARANSGGEAAKSADKPVAIGPQECAACGMVVRDQPAPRAQAVHRDGTRRFFCSIGDLIQYQQAPSPHGHIVRTYVEAMPAGVDPDQPLTAARPWIKAETAHFLLGAKRRGIMGPPVLSFATATDAAEAKKRLKATATYGQIDLQLLTWTTAPKAVLAAAQRPHVH